jgi:uncharacterized repeat protein (TIGR02543 family)
MVTLTINKYYTTSPTILINGIVQKYNWNFTTGDEVEIRFKKLSGFTYTEGFTLDSEPLTITGLDEGDTLDGYHYLKFIGDAAWDSKTLLFSIDIADRSNFKTVTASGSYETHDATILNPFIVVDNETYYTYLGAAPAGATICIAASFSMLDTGVAFDKLNASSVGITDADITKINWSYNLVTSKYISTLYVYFTMPNSDVTAILEGKAETISPITYYVDGSQYQQPNYAPEGGLIGDAKANYILVKEPSKAGYTFDGWFTDEALTTEATSNTEVAEGGLNLYAKFIAISSTHTVTFKEGNETIATVEVDDTQRVMPIEPLHSTDASGNEFVYWALNNVEYDFTTPVENDITLVAVYAKAGSSKWIMSLPNCYVGLKSDIADLPIARVADGTKALALSATAGEETAYMFNKATLTWIELQHYSVRI